MILNIHIAPMDRWRDAVVHLDRLSGMTVSGNFQLRLVVPKNLMRTAFTLCLVLIWLIYIYIHIGFHIFHYFCIYVFAWIFVIDSELFILWPEATDVGRQVFVESWKVEQLRFGGLAPAFLWIFIDIPDLSRSHSHPQVPRFRSDGFNATALPSTLVALGCQQVVWDIVMYCGIRSRCCLESDTETPVSIQHSTAPLPIPIPFA